MLKKLLVLLFSSFFLVACSHRPVKEEVSFASWGSVTEVAILKNIITEFEKENPEIKVNFIHIPQNYFQKIHLLFASHTPPDVIFVNNLYLPLYANYLEDVSDIVDKNAFFEQSIKGLSFQGKLLAVPRDISNLVFYVNTDIVSLPDKDWKLEDLLKKSSERFTTVPFTVSFEEDVFWMLPYLAYYGEIFDENFNAEKSKGFNFYIDLRDNYKLAPSKSKIGSSTLAQMFLEQKVAMYLSGRWMFPKISEKAKFNWAVINFPKGIGYLPCDTSGWAISKSSKHKDASVKLVKFLSSPKSSEYFYQTGLVVPARVDIAQKLNIKKHNEQAFIDSVKMSQATEVSKNYKKLVDNFNSKNFN